MKMKLTELILITGFTVFLHALVLGGSVWFIVIALRWLGVL